MWHVFGINLFPSIECPTAPIFNAAGHVTNPCLNATVFGINWGLPEPAITGLYILGFGISILADLLVADPAGRLADDAAAARSHRPRTTRTSSCSARWPTSCR